VLTARHCLITGLAIVALAAPAAHATLLASRFGVSPQVQLISNWQYAPGQYYTGYQFTSSSLAPTLHTGTVDYQVDDWFGRWSQTDLGVHTNYPGTGAYPSGEEPYDTEAYYFDDDTSNLYFAVIVGFPSPANGIFLESRYSNAAVTQGDFALDTPGVSGSQQDSWGFQYDYGVDLADENRPASGNVTSFASNTLGSNVYRTTTGWYLGTPDGAVNPVDGNESNAYTNFDPNSPYNAAGTMTNTGAATVSWYQLNLTYSGSPVLENNWQTYVIEMTIPRSALVTLRPGDQLRYHWLMGCRNDGSEGQAYLTGGGDIDSPEPGTLALLLMGAGPFAVWARKRRQQKAEQNLPAA
jgi:hypothetical protein